MTDITDAGPRLRQMNEVLAENERLREAIRRLADQDATLSVVGDNVIVQMEDTLTGVERAAIERAVRDENARGLVYTADVLEKLLERLA
jgi:hypothetical protein